MDRFDPNKIRWDRVTKQFIRVVDDHPIFMHCASAEFVLNNPWRFLDANSITGICTPPATVSNTTAGASIGDDVEFVRLLNTRDAAKGPVAQSDSFKELAAYIDARRPAVGMVAAPDLGEVWRVIDAAIPALAKYHCPALHALSKGDKEIFARAILTAAPDLSVRDALTDAQIVEVLASLGIDSEKSRYEDNPVLQVRTSVPGVRNIVQAYIAALRSAAPSTDTGAKS